MKAIGPRKKITLDIRRSPKIFPESEERIAVRLKLHLLVIVNVFLNRRCSCERSNQKTEQRALEIFTRGKRVNVPAEAMLTFQLEKRPNLDPVQRSRWQNGASP
jgi:hypothetical protein